MTFLKHTYKMRFFTLLLVFSLVIVSAFPANATNIDSLEQSTSNLEDELSGLQGELETLNSEISSISAQIQTISEEISQTKAELAIAKGNESTQYQATKARIKYMYENGRESFLEMLLSSASMADFLSRAEIYLTISQYDQDQLEKLVKTQESIAAKEEALARQQESLIALQEDLAAKEQAINSQISTASDELAATRARLAQAKADVQKAQADASQEVEPVVPPKEEVPESETNTGTDSIPETTPSKENDTNNDKTDNSNIASAASDVELFAALIECESGSTDYEAMLAVASVVVNRMKHPSYPDTLRGVIYQAGQFTPAHNGKLDHVIERGVKSSCIAVANDALAGKNNVGECLNFRSASSGHVGTVIGGNVFF